MGHVNSGLLDQSDSSLADAEAIGLSRADMTAINSGLHDVPGVRLPLQTASYASPSPTHAVFMYSGSGDGGGGGGGGGGRDNVVTLQLRGTTVGVDDDDDEDVEDKVSGVDASGTNLASVLARLQQEDATLSISYQDGDVLAEGSIDVLLGSGALHAAGADGAFDLFDSESGQDLTLSPQTFTSSTEAFLNDNSDSLPPTQADADTVGSSNSEDAKVSAAASVPAASTKATTVTATPAPPASTPSSSSSPTTTAIVAADSGKLAVKKSRPKASSPNRQGPQQCLVCGKVFGNASALAKHKLTHSDERKYVCSMCGKAFKRQDHLNGHMLTHRNKKPFECKAEGCGKSYCDARSLRRHTENHHTTPAGAARATPSTAAASEEATSCIQYAPPPPPYPSTSSSNSPEAAAAASPSQLQQLLSSPSANASPNSPSTSNQAASPGGESEATDGLTRQHLELIQQIMQQTQQQAAAAAAAAATKAEKPVKSRTWTASQNAASAAAKTTSAQAAPAANSVDPKPVECNLCHRKFKNVPALNGHMRLHGGYFKKDSEAKKTDKKDSAGPPLQTASVSVRALIEEKIIQKRITNPSLQQQASSAPSSGATTPAAPTAAASLTPPATSSTQNGGSTASSGETSASSSTFPAAAAPPPQYPAGAKTFVLPTAPSPGPPPEKVRRHSDSSEPFESVAIKRERSCGDATTSVASPLALAIAAELAEQASAGAASFNLAAFTGAAGGATFFNQDDVFQQVPEAVLQLAESIQFQAEDMAALDDFQSADTNGEAAVFSSQNGDATGQESNDFPALQSVTLADIAAFSAVASQKDFEFSPSAQKDGQTVFAFSPQHSSKDNGGTYNFSPHTTSPLPSPLQGHDSPSFAYPTPPASQEGPTFGLLQAAPLGSPHGAADSTFAYYAGALSPSAAAVEAALNEVLPGDAFSRSHQHALLYQAAPSGADASSAAASPLSATSVASPMSSVAAPSSTAASPVAPSGGGAAFALQMMPNSDDPLLSSSPKDFGGRKRFDFGLLRGAAGDATAILSGLGLVLENNGELRFYPTSGTASPSVTSTTCTNLQQQQQLKRPKEELDDADLFLSPSSVAPPTQALPRLKRPRPRPDPLFIPAPHEKSTVAPRGPLLFKSRLRAPRLKSINSTFTPPPMLDPCRNGAGLFHNLKNEPNSSATTEDTAMDTDSMPHINISHRHQVSYIPPCEPCKEVAHMESSREHLLWNPDVRASEGEIDMYLEFACCAAVPGGGRNKEYALHLLNMCHGNVKEAMLKLMQPTPSLPAGHPLLSYCYSDSARWAHDEIEAFQQALLRHGKDFRNVAKDVSSKSEVQCVQFYYFWKKVCPEEYQRLKLLRQRTELAFLRSVELDELTNDKLAFQLQPSDAEVISSTCSADTRLFMCEYPDCSASFNSRAALNGHVRIHGGNGRRSPTPDGCKRVASGTPPIEGLSEEFPCKVCGKVFGKIKSRSAHMKSHRPPDAEPKRPKADNNKTTNTNNNNNNNGGGDDLVRPLLTTLPAGLGLI
ncbi:mucin-5AC-like isoform X2 [Neocloeon triangulifer]|uniref:mucin-5AC-like isoform X2 n=1 Tax=Neocloeon triangulifer TaxID=2078957 RepID=UPI00286F3514|nr:mucin-5AC-like isoform X2 [Neocloeon triangulifer]